MYIGLQVKFPIFLIDFNKIWDSRTSFYESFKYQILRKYDQNKPRQNNRAYIWT